MPKVTVRDLVKKFKFEIVCGDDESLNRPVELPDTNRPGLELAGYFQNSLSKRLVVLGEKESGFVESQMDEVSQRRSFEFLTHDDTPAIIICSGRQCSEVLEEIANRKNFPVLKTGLKTSATIVNLTNYLEECLAESQIIHGELLRMYGVGVLMTGESGMGKSEITLELIKKGHQLVADDRVDCYHIHNSLFGRTPPLLEGFMELRGVGVINVTDLFGVGSYASEARILLHIDLVPFVEDLAYDRVGLAKKEYTEIFGIKILKISIPVSPGRPISTIIETAVSNYLLAQTGVDSAKEFENRVLKQIELNKTKEDDENANLS